jgi:heme O synthase-like polyprenyltransferase
MMSESTAPLTPLWQDYLELTKPRVVALMIVTALIGMCMAVPGWVPLAAIGSGQSWYCTVRGCSRGD